MREAVWLPNSVGRIASFSITLHHSQQLSDLQWAQDTRPRSTYKCLLCAGYWEGAWQKVVSYVYPSTGLHELIPGNQIKIIWTSQFAATEFTLRLACVSDWIVIAKGVISRWGWPVCQIDLYLQRGLSGQLSCDAPFLIQVMVLLHSCQFMNLSQ